MILKNFHFPILYFVLIFTNVSCHNDVTIVDNNEYTKLINKGNDFIKNSQLDSAYSYYTIAKESCSNKKGDEYAYVQLQIATIQQFFGDNYSCEETITDALSNYQNTSYKPYFYNLLAVTYDNQKRYDEAMSYYKKAENTYTGNYGKILAKNNIGLLYLEKKQYQKAITIFNPLLTTNIKDSIKDYAMIVDNLGYSQYKSNSAEAITNLLKAYQIRDSIKYDIGLIASNMHLAEYYKKSNNELSKKYALDALVAATKINSPDDKLEALHWIIESNNPKMQTYALQYIKLNDSITTIRQNAKNQFAKVKYDVTESEKKADNYKYKFQLQIIISAFLFFIFMLLFYIYKIINKKKLQYETYTTETRIAKKVHDELANDVYNSLTFVQTQNLQDPDKKETLIDNLDKIYSQTRNISKENSTINTGEKFESDLKKMISSYISNDVNVIIKSDPTLQWSKISPEKKIAIYRVMQELLVNMKKHSQATIVLIGFEHSTNTLEINYKDNGKGTVEMLKLQNGLQNAENRIHTIKGRITFDSETGKGFTSKISVPF